MSGLVRRVGATFLLVTAFAVVSSGPAGAYVTRVDMAGMRFTPARVEVELGDTVIWEAGDDGHTVTARDGSFDSSSRGLMDEGDQFRWRFRTPGTYGYFCRVHQNRGMQGEIVVVDPYAASTTTTRLVTPVTAAATTSTTAATATTVATEPPTTTSRPLATSSSTSPSVATSTTAPAGTPVTPQEPPALNPKAPVVGTAEADANLPGAQPAARRSEAKDDVLPAIVLGSVALLALFGGVVGVRARRRR